MAFCVGTLRGSSPHVRGALVWSCPYCGHSGIIPACAGSTRYSTTGKQGRRDHPRMSGEHGGVNNNNNPTLGSSPHVRGAHAMTGEKTQVYGIIPACTGSTTTSSRTRTGRWDHPRMCGEHFDEWIDDMSATGSSPHVRGAPCCLVRTTPSWGSSPHVRGAPVVHGLLDGLGGIIPACAGSTTPPAQDRHATRDHPRMCGEHIQRVLRRIAEQGSSPHVRGARSSSVGG